METELSRKDRNILLLVTISLFAYSWVIIRSPAEFYGSYLIFVLLIPRFTSRFGIPGNFWLFSFYLLFTGLFNIVLGNDTADQFFKIFIGLVMSYLFYFYVLKWFDYNAELIFHYYLKAALIVSIIGLIQFVSFVLHFSPGYDFRWLPFFNKWGVIGGGNLGLRINSVVGEPSQFAALMSPAMFVALYNMIFFKTYVFRRWQSVAILVAYLFTFSSVGYIGLFVAIVLLLINYGVVRYLLLFIPILIGAFLYLYNKVPDFQYRWDSTVRLFQTGEIDIKTEHGSSIVFYNNYVVATENFKTNFLFGTGLGSHPVAFDKYSLTKDIQTFGFANNTADANSMFLRIISECGLIGVIAVFFFISRFFVKREQIDPHSRYWIISSSCLCIIVLYLLRQGHYFINGFPLFVLLYYYNRKNFIAYKEAGEVETDPEEDAVTGEQEVPAAE